MVLLLLLVVAVVGVVASGGVCCGSRGAAMRGHHCGDVVNAGPPLVLFVLGVEADKVLLRVAGHLRGGQAGAQASKQGAEAGSSACLAPSAAIPICDCLLEFYPIHR